MGVKRTERGERKNRKRNTGIGSLGQCKESGKSFNLIRITMIKEGWRLNVRDKKWLEKRGNERKGRRGERGIWRQVNYDSVGKLKVG